MFKKILRREKLILLICFTSLISSLATLLTPIVIGKAIDGFFTGDLMKHVWVLVALFVTAFVFGVFTTSLSSKVTSKIQKDFQDQIAEKVLKMDIVTMTSKSKGEITALVTKDVINVGEGLIQGLIQFFASIVTIVGTLVLMFTIDVSSSLVVGLLTPISIVVSMTIAKKIQVYFSQTQNLQGKMQGFLSEKIKHMEQVKNAGFEEAVRDEFDKLNKSHTPKSYISHFYSALINPTSRILNNSIYIAVGVVGIFMGLSVGEISTFLIYTNNYAKPFNEISSILATLQKSVASFERIEKFLMGKEIEFFGTKEKLSEEEVITFEGVDFSYGEKPFIENFNLQIKKGEKVAFVGETGSGKTTLVNLVMGFLSPTKGRVKIFGSDISTLAKSFLWENVSMVMQDPWIMEGSALDNLQLKNATHEKIQEVAKICHLENILSRNDENVEKSLSQGEKQLLTIGRVMLQGSPVLILDEATSKVDSLTEQKVHKAFENLMESATSIIIAHRLSTIEKCDRIVVLKNGKVVEQGGHSELLEKKGYYHLLYESQFKH